MSETETNTEEQDDTTEEEEPEYDVPTTEVDGVPRYSAETRYGTVTFRQTTELEARHLENIEERGFESSIRRIGEFLEPGDAFFDLGAHLGFFSCLIGVIEPDAEIIAVEPHDATRERLKANLHDNGVDATVLPYAIAGKNGTTGKRITYDPSGGMAGVKSEEKADETMEVRTLDGLIEEEDLPIPRVIKSDIEGQEGNLVLHGEDVLSDPTVERLYIEFHEKLIEPEDVTVDELYDQLGNMGYDVIEETYPLEHIGETVFEK